MNTLDMSNRYACSRCDKTFSRKYDMQRHEQNEHDTEEETSEDDVPLVGIYADVGGNVNEATIELKKHGIHDIYKVPVSNAHFTDEDRLPWLELLFACIQEGERVIQHNALSLIREIEQRKQENESLRNNIKQLESKLEQSQATQDTMKNEIARLKKEISKERGKSKEMGVSLSENKKRAKNDKETCRQERIVMEKEMRRKDQQLLNLKTKLKGTEQNGKTLKDEMDKMKTERSELSKKADTEKDSLMNKLASFKRKIEEQKRNETTLLQNIEQLKARIDEIEKEQPSVNAEKEQELESLQQHEKSLQRKLLEKERKVKTLTQKIDQLTEKHTQDTKKVERELESSQRREKSLQGKIQEKECKVKTLAQKMKQLTEEHKHDTEKMEKDKRVLAADMKERETSLMQINLKLEEERRYLEEELKNLESREQALIRTVAEKEREEESHRTWEEERTRFEEEISSLESNWKMERDTRQQRTWRMEQLEREAKKLRNKIQRESEIRHREKKTQRRWMQNFITWVSPRKDNLHDEFPVGIYVDVGGNNEATIELKKHGIHDIYKVPVSNAHFNDEDRLPWLELLFACIQEGKRKNISTIQRKWKDKRVLAADMKERETSLMQINLKLEEERRYLEEELKNLESREQALD
nr:trichohyalin-like [Lytechinus pictus]